MSSSVDLTDGRGEESISAASKCSSEFSSPARPVGQTGSRNKIRPVPKNYVCKRCKIPGHYIMQCPKLSDKKFDSKPPRDYSCHACGVKGDHFIHSCPKKLPKGLLKKKKAGMRNQSGGESSGSNPNLSPLGPRRDVRSTTGDQPELSGISQNRDEKTSGHVRKRSGDVEFVSQSRKRFKPESIENYEPVVLSDSPPQLSFKELAVRTHPRQEGRLSPWDTERNDVDMGVEPPPFVVDTVGLKSDSSLERQDSRAQRIAELEAANFLAELELEIEEGQVHEVLATHANFPSLNDLLADFDIPPQENPGDSPSETSQASRRSYDDFVSKCPGTDSNVDADIVSGVDDLSTPTPPPTPPTIEPYVTRKPLSAPRYGAYTCALFEDPPNFWVRRPNRRETALSLWATPDWDNQSQEKWTDQTACEDVRENESAAGFHNVLLRPARR